MLSEYDIARIADMAEVHDWYELLEQAVRDERIAERGAE
jgi:hypothetical protein